MRLISSKGVPKIRERQAAPSPDTSWAGALRVMSSPAPGPAGVGPALGEHPAPCWGLRTPKPPLGQRLPGHPLVLCAQGSGSDLTSQECSTP